MPFPAKKSTCVTFSLQKHTRAVFLHLLYFVTSVIFVFHFLKIMPRSPNSKLQQRQTDPQLQLECKCTEMPPMFSCSGALMTSSARLYQRQWCAPLLTQCIAWDIAWNGCYFHVVLLAPQLAINTKALLSIFIAKFAQLRADFVSEYQIYT
jgi:cytochrome c oxidase assembly factor CtaG